jgi:hypothetical protein
MSTISRRTVVATALTAVAAGTVTPALALPTVTELQCSVEDTIEHTYGLTLAPSASDFRSTGYGTLTCTGTVEGVAVEGTGPFSMTGHSDNTWCGGGTGHVDYAASVPRKDGRGKVKLSGRVEWVRVGLVLHSTATSGPRLVGPMYAQPLDGDCRNEPVTTVRLRGPALVTPAA